MRVRITDVDGQRRPTHDGTYVVANTDFSIRRDFTMQYGDGVGGTRSKGTNKMRIRTVLCAAIAAVCTAALIPIYLEAQEQPTKQNTSKRHSYRPVIMETFGGPNSYFTFIFRSLNSHGVATGTADTPVAINPPFCLVDCFLTHAFQWKDGDFIDLGALPAVGASFPSDINSRGVVVGLSLNGGTDSTLGLPFFDAVVWKDGQIIDLETFGGPLSYAAAINDHDEVVGFALNSTPDSFDLGDFCQNFPMPTQMRAFIWHDGALQDLGTLGGTDSCALFVNDRGQTAGNSFTNSTVNPSTGLPTLHPFLWHEGKMLDLGTLGGTLAVANGINRRGQVGGVSTLAGDQALHPFLWDKGQLMDFDNLGGDFVEVIALSETGEMVGKAQLPGSTDLHAFLAKNGHMIDLGTQDGRPMQRGHQYEFPRADRRLLG
jgi:probable HAF family extracellular repeat protein